ncbi:MAG: hypothetical protein CL569_08170 [Alphaproteobacteria bacterium]|nr:hypothetical protein [Alphaproteobacteria bacterium]
MPEANTTHAVDVCLAALEFQDYVSRMNEQRSKMRLTPLEIKIGIHTGSVMAGVVGTAKFTYDIWGVAVNIAERLESAGEAGQINRTRLPNDRMAGANRLILRKTE